MLAELKEVTSGTDDESSAGRTSAAPSPPGDGARQLGVHIAQFQVQLARDVSLLDELQVR